MKVFVFVFLIAVGIFIFVAYRFGFLSSTQAPLQKITQLINAAPTTGVVIPIPTSLPDDATSLAAVSIVTNTESTKSGSQTTIRWQIDTKEPTDVYHTAIHFGPYSQPNPKLTSDYPEKSEILTGPIPATFSAQVKFPKAGTYFYRAMVIVNNKNIWSPEKSIIVTQP